MFSLFKISSCLVVLFMFGVILKMEDQSEYFRHILLSYFKKGKRAAKAHRKICAVYETEAVTKRTCQNWFAKFRSRKYSVQDAPRQVKLMKTG